MVHVNSLARSAQLKHSDQLAMDAGCLGRAATPAEVIALLAGRCPSGRWKGLRVRSCSAGASLDYAIIGDLQKSVEPKVRLQGCGFNPFCSHSSRCLAVLVWQYFEESFCAPKVRLKWYGFKGFPSHSSHCSGGLFPHYSGVSPKRGWQGRVSLICSEKKKLGT